MLSAGALISRFSLMMLIALGLCFVAPSAPRAQETDPDFVPLAEFGNDTIDASGTSTRGKLINQKTTSKPTQPTAQRIAPAATVRSLQEASLAAIVREQVDNIQPPPAARDYVERDGATERAVEPAPQPHAAPARQAVAAPLQLQPQQKTTYVIATIPASQALQVGDRLQLDIKNQPELSTELSISPDGKIDLPLFGTIKIAGQTLGAVQAQITAAYASGYFVSPQIALSYLKPAPKE